MNDFTMLRDLVRYKRQSLFLKNLTAMFLIIFIIVMIITVGCYWYYADALTDTVEETNNQILERACIGIDSLLYDADRMLLNLCGNSEVSEFMSNDSNDITKYETVREINNLRAILAYLGALNDKVDSVDVYSYSKQRIVSTSGDSRLAEEILTFAEEFKKSDKNVGIRANEFNLVNSNGSITIYRKAPVIEGVKKGIVMITVNNRIFTEQISSEKFGNNLYFMVVDENDNVVYCNRREYINEKYNEKEFCSRELPGKVIINSVNSHYNDWRYISFVSSDKYYSEVNEKLIFTLILSFLLSIMAAFFASLWSTWRAYKPIKVIADVLGSVNEDRFDPVYLMERPNNELTHIIGMVFDNYKRRCELEVELDKRRIIQERAQLIALQAQINPHFLYNTLENINWSAIKMTGGVNEISEMISCLSKCMRIILETREQVTTIKKELEHVELYAKILMLRHRDRFKVVFDADESITEAPIVKLSLQPLVENALYHGILKKTEYGEVIIKVYAEESCNVTEIINTGIPVDDEQLKKINEGFADININENTQIGLMNVNQRIKLSFGSEYGLKMYKNENDNTVVKIMTPKRGCCK